MADTKTTALTAATSWASGDLLYLVRDPAGTPVSRKITIDNILQNLVCAANTSLIKSTSGYSLTGSNASSMIDLAGTWNTTGTPTLIKANVTDTASNAASLLMDLKVGGVSKFAVALTDGGLRLNGDSVSTIFRRSDVGMVIFHGANASATGIGSHVYLPGVNFGSAAALRWTNDTPASSADVILLRDAANTLALRNSTNAQAFNIYNTYTSGSVYERGFMRWVSNVLEIGTEHVGASARDIVVKRNGVVRITLDASNFTTNGGIVLAGDTDLQWTGRVRMRSSTDSILKLSNNADNDFNRLQFGGTTSSFPSIKRSTTILQARLADDSDFATYQGKLRVHANATSETVTPTHTLRLFDAAGTEYRVPAIAV